MGYIERLDICDKLNSSDPFLNYSTRTIFSLSSLANKHPTYGTFSKENSSAPQQTGFRVTLAI